MRKKDIRSSEGEKPAGRSKVPEAVTTGRQSDVLVADLRTMIDSARERAAAAVNSELVMLYWGIGERIRREILRGRRAEYGKQIVSMVSERLSAEYNRGFTEKNIRRMLQFAEVFPKTEIVAALPRQLSWSHLIEIIPLKEPLQRDFYIDLLFFHRRLNCLVVVELKLGRFSAAFKGQMELYLRWLEKHERRGHEEPPVGLIFCSGKDHEQVELLQLGEGEIRVAEYLTELPPREVLQNRLSAARRRAMEIIGDDKE